MDQATHNKIVSFIWGIADDVLRDVFVRSIVRGGQSGALQHLQIHPALDSHSMGAIFDELVLFSPSKQRPRGFCIIC